MFVPVKLTKAQSVYLDFVRAVAAQIVLFGHAAALFLQGGFLQKANIQIGAVPVFFLLSGFLISLSVFQKYQDPSYKFSHYFIDRFCRIYSAFIPALVFAAVVDAFIVHSSPHDWQKDFNIQTWIGNLFMLQDFPLFQIARRLGVPDNAWFVSSFGTAKPFWTISIEWWIYMLFGFVAYFRVREGKPFTAWQWVILGFLVIEPAYHFIGGPDRCLTMLWVIGMLASFCFLRLPILAVSWTLTERQWRNRLITTSLLALLAIVAHGYANKYHQQNAEMYHQVDTGMTEFQSGFYLAVALFSFLFALGTLAKVPRLIERAIGFLANYSYSLYLIHSTVLSFVEVHGTHTTGNPSLFWACIGLSNVIAILFWWLFERHHRKLAAILNAMRVREGTTSVKQMT